jgi:cysteinyl-tRNA synthetase
MRAYIFADFLRRALSLLGYQVNHVMNITDVGHLTDDADSGEDKMELGCRREGASAWEIARKYTEAFFNHGARLNILRPTTVCKATDHIPEQISLIEKLETKGFAYKTEDGLYFDTSKFERYPNLARLDTEGLREGLRVEKGAKRHKTDFALWKFAKAGEKRQMEWDSPWGRGFPGWHIECSAMAMKYLGAQFDIHTGGVDHIPIHHTNEIAQSECATGVQPFVRVWMHGEFLLLDDTIKMSKSAGHVLTVDTLIDQGYDPRSFRFLVLQTHYRKQLGFSYEALSAAQKGLERLILQVIKLPAPSSLSLEAGPKTQGALDYHAAFIQGVAQDLNMPQALAEVHKLVGDSSIDPQEKTLLLSAWDEVLGLDLWTPVKTSEEPVPQDCVDLLLLRNQARQQRQWAEADRLRGELLNRGFEILDSPQGSSLKKRS